MHYNIIGVDMSKAIFDTYNKQDNTFKQFQNTNEGIDEFIKQIKKNDVVVVESTGRYHMALLQKCQISGIKICVANPRQVRDFAKASGISAKTDKLDAKIIALFADKIEQREAKDTTDISFKLLISRRKQLKQMLNLEVNHREGIKDSILLSSINCIEKAIKEEMKHIDRQIKDFIKCNGDYARKNELLCSIKGVGYVTAATILCAMPELGKVSREVIAALAGVAPYNNDSGTMRGYRSIRGGRSDVRETLYMAALVSVRAKDGIMRDYYESLRNRGKPFKVAIVACMRKMLVHMNAIANREFYT